GGYQSDRRNSLTQYRRIGCQPDVRPGTKRQVCGDNAIALLDSAAGDDGGCGVLADRSLLLRAQRPGRADGVFAPSDQVSRARAGPADRAHVCFLRTAAALIPRTRV